MTRSADRWREDGGSDKGKEEKAEQEWGEIKRMREASGPEVRQNMRLKGDGGREAKGLVAP